MWGPAVVCLTTSGNVTPYAAPSSSLVGINNASLGPHTMLITIEGATPGMTFDLQVVRHFEGTPDDSAQSLEIRDARLVSTSNALELL